MHMPGTMGAMVAFMPLLLSASSHRILERSSCQEELLSFKKEIQKTCEEDQRRGATVSDGGCQAEAEAVVSDGDYEVWSQNLVKCGGEKTNLLLWSGYQDEERESVLAALRQQGGCVLQSKEKPDTQLGRLLNAPGVNTLTSCSWAEVQAFWVGASRQFASTWAARSQNVTVAIGYHIAPGWSYKTLFDTVFYRSELKAAVQAFRDKLYVSIIFTHPNMTEGARHAATSMIYERARLLSPVPAEKFQETTTWHYRSCPKEGLADCERSERLDPEDSTFLSNLGEMYRSGYGVALDIQKSRELFEKGCERGGAAAAFKLGWMYETGWGHRVSADYQKAKKYLELAMERGDPEAPKGLGWLYEHGQGVAQDVHKAQKLYQESLKRERAAAESGWNSFTLIRWRSIKPLWDY